MSTVLQAQEVTAPPRPPASSTQSRLSTWAANRPVRWSPFALGGLLVVTAVLYVWNLGASQYGNTFYAAAAQAGSQSWRAWLFGALDSQSFITVDKPPASLWVTGLSMRIFGVNHWAALAPQAVMGVLAVALLYATMRRVFRDPVHGTAAGLVSGAVTAFTPAAALMFRFNNPDALLVLLMVAAAYCLARAISASSGRWLALVGVALGFAFLTKMLQGLLVLPAFGLAYLLCAHTPWVKRVVHLIGATVALVVSAGWFVLVTIAVPAASRPYIGGSTDNSFMNLVLGYNGLSRISGGNSPGSGGGPGGGTPGSSFGGSTGLSRLVSSEMGNEISWLLPVALLSIVFAGYLAIRSIRRFGFADRLSRTETGAVIAWGGWLVVTAIVFSFMSGTVHPYYTVALAPAIGALIGLGGVFVWRRRAHWDGRIALAIGFALAGWWAVVLLNRNDFGPMWCRVLIGLVAAGAVIGVLVGGALGLKRLVVGAVIAGSVAGFGGTAAFSIATAATAHQGSIPTAVQTSMDSGMGSMGGGPGGSRDGSRPGGAMGGPRGSMGGGPGGGSSTSADLVALLKSSNATWAAAVNGSQSAAGIELASGQAVMAIGGWSGDPAPTLDEFVAYVKAGKIGYYISSSGMGGGRGGTSSEISTWVSEHYTAITVGGSTVYKLT